MDWDELIRKHDGLTEAILGSVSSPSPQIPVPTLMVIALQRSRAMVEAYRGLIADRNLVVASALIRMQLDSLMRVHACSLVDDPMKIWAALEADEQWSKVRDRDNKPLSDARMLERLSTRHPWVSDLYKRLSGYIHLGRPYLEAVITGKPFQGMQLSVGPAGTTVTDAEVAENLGHMVRVTEALLKVCQPREAREADAP